MGITYLMCSHGKQRQQFITVGKSDLLNRQEHLSEDELTSRLKS
jgi:hypothetical protein